MFLNNKEYSSFWFNGKQYDKGFLKGKQIFGDTLHFHTILILARASAIGATLPTDIGRLDTYVRSMYQIWMDHCDVFFRFRGTGDVNFKRINLANPESALADFYGGFTLDVSGIKGNGVNAYIDTNFNPSLLISGQKYQLNDASRGGVVIDATGGVIDGARGSASNALVNLSSAANRINQAVNGAGDLSGTGFKMISRQSATTVLGVNKDVNFTNEFASSAILNANQLVLSRQTQYSTVKLSSYFMGKSIPFSVSQQIRAAENADMANLGISQLA